MILSPSRASIAFLYPVGVGVILDKVSYADLEEETCFRVLFGGRNFLDTPVVGVITSSKNM
jgi:hypothetical protein